MQQTPKSLRLTIGIFGRTNTGKSSFLNMITGQDASIVSEIRGTTTDVVEKAMELLPVGPVLFLDTAGFDDDSALGEKRIFRSKKALKRADVAVIITTADYDGRDLEIAKEIAAENIASIIIFNKSDIKEPSEAAKNEFAKFGKILTLSSADKSMREQNITAFKKELLDAVPEEFIKPAPLLADLIAAQNHAVFVVPIDIQAPKGRLILPQVQAIRDVLDINAAVSVVQENTYKSLLENLKVLPDLVVCDSQAVDFVAKNTPENIKFTTFSIIFARNKGDLSVFLQGAKKIDALSPQSKILIAEACTHHPLEEDIGRVKIPKMLEKKLGFKPQIDSCAGRDFPQELEDYSLVIHCGACMLSRREMLVRTEQCLQKNVPVTNFGVAISFLQGVCERATRIFSDK